MQRVGQRRGRSRLRGDKGRDPVSPNVDRRQRQAAQEPDDQRGREGIARSNGIDHHGRRRGQIAPLARRAQQRRAAAPRVSATSLSENRFTS